MAVPLSINNPQVSTPETSVGTPVSQGTISYGGNSIGGNGGSTSTLGVSNILIYGAIGLFAVWILQRLDK